MSAEYKPCDLCGCTDFRIRIQDDKPGVTLVCTRCGEEIHVPGVPDEA